MRTFLPRLMLSLAVLAPLAAHAQEAGRAASVSGVVSVQRTDGTMGVVARGSPVRPGDTVTTQPESRAVIELRDGARLTVRPSSELRIEGYRFARAAPDEDSTFLRLLKGGMRTISGLLGQRRPAAFRLDTGTATIGIRGTDFVTRLCDTDCAAEAKTTGVSHRIARTPGYIARLVNVQGQVTSTTGPRAGKPFAAGDPVYAEDVLSTGPGSFGVLIFQDGTRVVLEQNTRFAVERYRYEPSRPSTGSVVFRLFTGGLRALTGLIARSNNREFRVNTSVATIGVRGTGFDMLCTGPCSDTNAPPEANVPAGLTLANWQGCNVATNDKGETQACEGHALNVASADDKPQPLEPVPDYFDRSPAPRPDRLKIDLNDYFGLQRDDFAEPGTYVQVRDGVVTLKGEGTELFTLAKGETGYIDRTGQRFIRLGVTPIFLDRDIYLRDGDPDDYGCFLK